MDNYIRVYITFNSDSEKAIPYWMHDSVFEDFCDRKVIEVLSDDRSYRVFIPWTSINSLI